MAKSPLAQDPDAPRKDRRTRIASGPAPMPLPSNPFGKAPTPPQVIEQAKAAESEAQAGAKKNIKKTQMIMGAPPLPPPVTGKTQVPTGPTPKAPTAAPAKLPPTPAPDPSLPSHQETVVGPAPLPPVPTPPKAKAAPPPSDDDLMAEMMSDGGLFESDFEDEPATALHPPTPPPKRAGRHDTQPVVKSLDPTQPPGVARTRGADATIPAPGRGPAPARGSDATIPAPSRTETPRAGHPVASPVSPTRDTVPAKPDGSPTDPRSIGIADTHIDTVGAQAKDVTGPPSAAVKSRPRDSRASTAMQGTEGLAAPPADAPKIRLVPGKVIPGTRYEIRRWLGEGGMGVVYEVSHVDIERRSALKILRFDLSQQAQMAQVFRDEARAASRLGSPNIVEVYDFGELSDGRLFFAMELLEGHDLVPADEQTTMEPERLIAILRQVCKGLAKAHGAGVVHRDVKPENIIISEIDGRADTVKIVDFGISAMLAAGEKQAGIAGTPHYMAPEQILGEAFDGRLDVYALGCTAYELVVGTPPFDADEVEDVLKQQVNATPPTIREARPDLDFPAELENVIMRCLAKKPEERYPDMAHLEAALCEAQIAAGISTAWDDLPVPELPDVERYERIVARMPSPHAPLQKRSWLWPVVAGTSTLAAASLATFLVLGGQPTDEEKDIVEQITLEARDAASKASWVIPPPNLPDDSATALTKVVELEAIEGSAESMADERGEELRHEFATTLITNGDRLWEGARGFARQYYAWSLMFEDNDLALERANIDAMTLERLRQRALDGTFNDADRTLAGFVALPVMEDSEEKTQMAAAAKESLESEAMAPLALAELERNAKSAGVDLGRPKRGSGAQGSSSRNSGSGSGSKSSDADPDDSDPDGDDPDGDDLVVGDDGEGSEGSEGQGNAGRKKRRRQVDAGFSDKAKSDPARSKKLTEQADAQRRNGHRNEAKSLYGQAIAANPRNGSAHLGLAQVHFDQGSYDKARKSAQQAVKHSPRNGRAYKTLGDAYYKAFRYSEAEQAYVEAQRLGVQVGKRLAEVRKKQGK